jgi:UDP-glucose 4-epimerase
MKFAVTGGAGFIGSNIVKNLIKNGHSVKVIDNLHTGSKENLKGYLSDIDFCKIDIRNYDELKKNLKNIDGVFHEAALTIVQESYLKPDEYFDVNVKGTENIFNIAKEQNFKIVYASSSSIYGDTKTIPIKEGFTRKPINPYGQTKLEDEFLAEKISKENIDVVGLRYFNVYGKGQTGTYAGVITKFINKLKENKSPEIFGDGSQIRDFIYVKDIADANLSAMKNNIKSGFFNIGTGKTTSIKELAYMMIKIFEKEFEPIFLDPLKGDVKKSQADTNYTKNKLNWKYKIELNDGLRNFLK